MVSSANRHLGVLAVTVVVLAAACSSDDPEAAETDPVGATLTMNPVGTASEAQLEDAISVVEARLAGLGAEADVRVDGDALVIELDGSDADIAEDVADLLGRQGALRFRPALCQVPTEDDLAQGSTGVPPGEGADPVCGSPDPTTYVTTPPLENTSDVSVTLDNPDMGTRHRFGPAQVDLDGTTVDLEGLVTRAVAKDDPLAAWQVQIDLARGERGEAFNELAAACFGQTEICPTGQAGIILDQRVYSVLGFQEPQFHGTAVISGDFNQSEAEDLALVLRSGALPVPFDVAVSGDPSSDPSTDSE